MSHSTPAKDAEELVELAAVARAHGLRGEVQLKLFNPDSDLLLELERVTVRAPDGSTREHAIEYARRHAAQSMIVQLSDIDGRTAAEQLRGSLLCIARSALPEPEEGEFYLVDLAGLKVEEEGGEALGEVLDVLEYPSVVCLAVDREGIRWEIPMLDRYLVKVDMEQRRVVVRNLEELADLQQPAPRGRD